LLGAFVLLQAIGFSCFFFNGGVHGAGLPLSWLLLLPGSLLVSESELPLEVSAALIPVVNLFALCFVVLSYRFLRFGWAGVWPSK
jgi:hypothetical protein